MPAILVQIRVQDYNNWRKVFDETAPVRLANGLMSTTILQQENDPNSITLLFEVQDLERAKRFAQSPELKQIQQRAGVAGPPSFTYFDKVQHPSYQAASGGMGKP